MKFVRPVVICAVLLGGSYAAWHFTRPAKKDAAPTPPVPVSAAQAKQAELPVYIPTIGNVRALNSVENPLAGRRRAAQRGGQGG